MFKVTFGTTHAPVEFTDVFQSKGIEPCVEFALALHRSSNIPHTITVSREGVSHLILATAEKPTEESK